MWNENMLRTILKPVGRLCKVDLNSEEISKGLFARDYLEVDIGKPLKKLKYIRGGHLYECIIGYENITNICYGCGSQTHEFDPCSCNIKSMVFQAKKCRNCLRLTTPMISKLMT